MQSLYNSNFFAKKNVLSRIRDDYTSFVVLLHNHSQIHVGVNCAVQVVSAGRIEWSHCMAVIAVELYLDGWCARFFGRPGCSINPASILNDVHRACIIDHIQATALASGNAGLYKGCCAKLNDGASTPASDTRTTTWHKQDCYQP